MARSDRRFPRWIVVLGVWLCVECFAVGLSPHTWNVVGQSMAAPIVFSMALLILGRDRLLVVQQPPLGLSRRWMAIHLAAIAGIGLADYVLLVLLPASAAIGTGAIRVGAIGVWYASVLGLVWSATCAIAPPRSLVPLARRLGIVWVYAAVTSALAIAARTFFQGAWNAPASSFGRLMQTGALIGTQHLLALFYPRVIVDPATSTIGTGHFQVEVAGGCSGVEGVALMLALTLGWLAFTRKELRLARAAWLVPAALVTVWLCNLVRLAGLIAIGDAGYPEIAVQGFHSEAGWIFFNLVAIGFLLASQQIAWFRREPQARAAAVTARNPTAIYLVPFLAITAASLLTRAASSGFDWLYPVRFFAALAALWAYRADYRRMNWRFGWAGPCAGVAVFLLWLGIASGGHFLPGVGGPVAPAGALAVSLARMAPAARVFWLVVRTLAAVLTVPVAEELCFRGFLARRMAQEDFEQVPYARTTWLGVAVSSIVFGLLHGNLWIAGTAAGLVFALLARWRNRLGEAVAAHAVANLLIAVWVLTTGDFSLW